MGTDPASLKGAQLPQRQRVTCTACAAFVASVGGIRGPVFGRPRRHFYSTGRLRRSRCGPRVVVSPHFFRDVVDTCGHWLVDHLAEEDDPVRHLAHQQLPPWVSPLIRQVDFRHAVGRDAAITVCAELLGISRQQVYARIR